MGVRDFEAAVEACIREIRNLPAAQHDRLMALVAEAQLRQQELSRSLHCALDALDDWRLYEKYRLFDEECRIREAQDVPEEVTGFEDGDRHEGAIEDAMDETAESDWFEGEQSQ